MLCYTARNGTNFQYVPDSAGHVYMLSAEVDGLTVPLDVDDLREFLDHLENPHTHPHELDAIAVASD